MALATVECQCYLALRADSASTDDLGRTSSTDRTVRSPDVEAALTAAVIGGYILGTFPTAQLVGRARGFDPTAEGSGNPGASNVTRVGGARAGALVFAGDAGKGLLAAALGYAVDGRTTAWIVGAAAVLGHVAPITRRFRGGKGVATAGGVTLVCAPLAFVVMTTLFGVLVKVSGKAAVGSIVAAAGAPVAVAALGQTAAEVTLAAVIAAAVIVRHRENIVRLLGGTESGVRPGATRPERD